MSRRTPSMARGVETRSASSRELRHGKQGSNERPPLHQIREPISTPQQLQVQEAEFGERPKHHLAEVGGSGMIDRSILGPVHHPTHVVRHAVPAIRGGHDGNDGRHGEDHGDAHVDGARAATAPTVPGQPKQSHDCPEGIHRAAAQRMEE